MAEYFLESSAFAKRYKFENGSSFVNRLFIEDNQLIYLNLTILEIRKIFFRLRFNPQSQDSPINDQELGMLESRFAADLLSMQKVVFTGEMLNKAIEVIQNVWVPSVFDLSQLSAFLIAKQIYSDILFVCSDRRSKLIMAARHFIETDKVIIPEDVA